MKKLLSVFLALVMLLGMMGTVAFAEGEEPAFVVSDGSAEPGQTVEITVSLENNPGVCGIELEIKYDETVLQWTKRSFGEYDEQELDDGDLLEGQYLGKVGESITWTSFGNFTKDAVFVTLTFKVKEDADPGTTQVSVFYKPNNVYAYEFDEEGHPTGLSNVSFAIKPGTVTIEGEDPPTPTVEDGFYLAGKVNGEETWVPAEFTAARRFVPNPSADSENESLLETTLAVGDNFKVVKVVNGAITDYYPPEGSNYDVTDAYAGDVTIYFKNGEYVGNWGAFGNYFYIVAGHVPFAEVYGASVSMGGDIGLNFYLELPEAFLSESGAYAVITSTTEDGKSSTTLFSEAKSREVEGEEGKIVVYQFVIKLSAKEMNETATIRLYKADGTPMALRNNGEDFTNEGFSFSIREYIDKARATGDAGLAALMEALSDYGATAQIALGYTHTVPAELYHPDDIAAVTADKVASYAEVVTPGTATGLSFVGVSTVLRSETALRIYFELEEGSAIGDFTFKVDGKKVTPQHNDDGYFVEISNINAKKLDKTYTVVVTKTSSGAKVLTVKYSVLSYVYKALTSDKATEDVQNMAKALYLYNQKVHAYFG